MISIGIASIPDREASLQKVIESLHNQADSIFIVLNGYIECPKFIWDYKNVMATIGDNVHGSNSKFTMAEYCKGFYVSWDDDILATPHIIEILKEACDKNKGISTFHGKRYDGQRPIPSYRRSYTTNARCLNSYPEDIELHVGGTGCMGFYTDVFKVRMDIFKYKNMSDIQVAAEAHRQGVKIYGLAHEVGWIKYIPPKGKTIWQTSSKDDHIQTQILNSFLK